MGSWKVARLAGIDVYIHWTFTLLFVWIGFSVFSGGGTMLEAVQTMGFVSAVFGCVVLHELGHALAARRYGIGTRDITLLPIGGVARLERMPTNPWQEFIVAIAGPAVNVVIAGTLFAGILLSMGSVSSASLYTFIFASFVGQIMIANVVLIVFNMIPAFPMDGGRVLRALLATQLRYDQATNVAAGVGQVVAVGFGVLGFFGNPMLLLIAVFIFFGARAEASMAATRQSLSGAKTRDAMLRQFHVLQGGVRVADIGPTLVMATQEDYPVVEANQLLGMVSRSEILTALEGGRGGETLAALAHRNVPTIHEDDLLVDTLEKMQGDSFEALPVVRNGALVGMITVDNMQRWARYSKTQARQRSRDAETGTVDATAWKKVSHSGT